eukprot:CAMPEP_0183718584 /NCGR_PEP_ID=MMETSP0737-20130205/11805_1 /TAXON_ID=385413 /ORGANISM="Thalassiosira miniscula, Strain CCMP1093" /LENGTH=257 /DNA_ID=CAMNT_0025948173 /DNA_START=32 /DNA_END=805 /DNA_ORIENTATION=-
MSNNIFRSPILKAGMQSATIMTLADIATQLVVEDRSFFFHDDNDNASVSHDDDGGEMLQSQNTNQQQKNQQHPDHRYYDPYRTLRWSIVGLTLHGPYFLTTFRKLDAVLGTVTATNSTLRGLSLVMKKTTVAQFIIFPPYLVALFSYMGLMEHTIHHHQNNNNLSTNKSTDNNNKNKSNKMPHSSSKDIQESIVTKVKHHVPTAFLSGCAFWPIVNSINFAFVPSWARVPYLASVGGIWNGYLSFINANANAKQQQQ